MNLDRASCYTYLERRTMRQTSFQLQHSARHFVSKGCFAPMVSVSGSRSMATPSTKPITSTSSLMSTHGVVWVCCRCGFDRARSCVSPLESGHKCRLGGASSCGGGAASMKHCDRLMKIWIGFNDGCQQDDLLVIA